MDFIKFEPGNLCMVTGGRNTGRVGTIINRERHPGSFDIVHVKVRSRKAAAVIWPLFTMLYDTSSAWSLRSFNAVKRFFVVLSSGHHLYCICEIHCLAPDGSNLNTIQKRGSKEKKKSWRSLDSNPGLLDGKQECFLRATQPPLDQKIVQLIYGLVQISSVFADPIFIKLGFAPSCPAKLLLQTKICWVAPPKGTCLKTQSSLIKNEKSPTPNRI